MIDPDAYVRTTIYLPRSHYERLARAASASGEPLQRFLRDRLLASLPLSQTAARSGCAGNGEVRAASPELTEVRA